jgi:hypothetical protein
MPSNIFGNDPSRPDFSYKSIHFRPEMPFISCAAARSGNTEGLTGVAPADKIDGTPIEVSVKPSDVGVNWDMGPMLVQHGVAKGIDFTESDSSHSCLLESKAESADTGKEVEDIHGSPDLQYFGEIRALHMRRE